MRRGLPEKFPSLFKAVWWEIMTGKIIPMFDGDRIDNRNEKLINALLRVTPRLVQRYHRAKIGGIGRIPRGPALYVGNHNAGFYTPDTWIFVQAAYRAHGLGAVPYGLTHEMDLAVPPLNWLLAPLGSIRATHGNAKKAFDAGHKVLVYPGGDVDTMRPFRHRNRIVFGGRTGYIRLALSARVPIVPIVAAGAHSTWIVIDDMRWLARAIRADKLLRTEVWPLILSFPLGLTLFPLPPYLPFPSKILMEVLEPVSFAPNGPEAAGDPDYVRQCADRVETSMQDCLTMLAEKRKENSLPGRAARGLGALVRRGKGHG